MNTLARYHAANLPELMEKITRNGIGIDDYLNRFWETESQTNYPPYNLVYLSNHESRLEVALAGFKKEEVKVFTEFGKLHVEGIKEDKETDATYQHRGLGTTFIQTLLDTQRGLRSSTGRICRRTLVRGIGKSNTRTSYT